MRIFTPEDKAPYSSLRDAVFLAGPTIRNNEGVDWRIEACKLFEKYGFTGDILSPLNNHFDDSNYLEQVNWERRNLFFSSVVLFWIPRTEKNPGFTTNVEFGEWMGCGSVVLGGPDWAIKNRYLKTRFEMNGGIFHNTLEGTVKAAIDMIDNRHKALGGNTFFTSDTHFSQQRTLELSARPFTNTLDMDYAIVSNWNKRLNSQSTIFHLGDFGGVDYLPFLNFSKMYLILGNYDTGNKELLRALKKDGRVVVRKNMNIKIGSVSYHLCHEPTSENESLLGSFNLFGHIHRLQTVKRNGINVGVDCHRFTPVSVKELMFLYGGVKNHFDENVFTDVCK